MVHDVSCFVVLFLLLACPKQVKLLEIAAKVKKKENYKKKINQPTDGQSNVMMIRTPITNSM